MSSLHDGMNLVAKEFVAARDDERGVLILSTFAGASRELMEALLVNPFDARATADALVGIGEIAKAIPLYEAIAASDPIAQYRLGVAQALSGQNDVALATLAKVQSNRARLAKLWTVYVQTKTAPTAVAAAPAT